MQKNKNLITVARLNLILVIIILAVLAYGFYAFISSFGEEKPKTGTETKTGETSIVEPTPEQESPKKEQTSSSTTNNTTNNTTNTTNVEEKKEEEPKKGIIPSLIDALGGGGIKLSL